MDRVRAAVLTGLLGQPAQAPKIGRYSILRRLGEGGMGVVYVVYDEQLDRRVALKVIKGTASSDLRARMLREGQAMAKLAHPNVVPVFEVGEHEAEFFLAMELVEGGTLREWMRAEERPWSDVLAMFVQAARGLAAAHDAGLLHRDFKPDNVLVGDDGRARVVDFGLARLLDAASTVREAIPDVADTDDAPLPETITRTGQALGTPAYMAPEQILGEEVDERTDVFAFCVSLFEALYGKRPFSGGGRDALAQAITLGRHEEPAADRGVPAWLQRIVLQGLRPAPAERPQTMQAMLDVLDVDPFRRRRRVRLAAGGVALAGLAAAAGFVGGGADAPCEGFEARLDGVWDDARRSEVEQAFLATESPIATAAWTAVEASLDARTTELVDEMTQACQATRIRGEQSEAMLDLRMACLDDRLRATRALTDVLAEADRTTVVNAADAAAALPEVALCRDAELLKSGLPTPVDAAQADAVAEIRDELASARALLDTGHPVEALEAVDEVEPDVARLDYAPLNAEAVHASGRTRLSLGRYEESRQALLRAVDLAEAERHDVVAAKAWLDLLYVGQELLRDHALADAWSRRAEAAVRRVGSPRSLHARLLKVQGNLAVDRGDLERATGLFAELEALDPRGSDLVDADPRLSRGRLAVARGDMEAAIEAFEQALADWLAVSGEHDPKVHRTRHNLGAAFLLVGRPKEALEQLQLAADGWRELVGEANPELGRSLISLGGVQLSLGELQAAKRAAQEAVVAIEGSAGTLHPSTADALILLGVVAFMEEDFATAATQNGRAVEILDAAFAVPTAATGNAVANLGEAQMYLGELSEARGNLDRAAAIMATTMGVGHPDRALPLKLLGLVHLIEGRPSDAVVPLREASTLVSPGRPYERADILAALAVALFPDQPAEAAAIAAKPGANRSDAMGGARRRGLIELLGSYESSFGQLGLQSPGESRGE